MLVQYYVTSTPNLQKGQTQRHSTTGLIPGQQIYEPRSLELDERGRGRHKNSKVLDGDCRGTVFEQKVFKLQRNKIYLRDSTTLTIWPDMLSLLQVKFWTTCSTASEIVKITN